VVATGTPEDIAACPESHTGQFLKRILEGRSLYPHAQPGHAMVAESKSKRGKWAEN
jgi:excinuclease ABC subunit A